MDLTLPVTNRDVLGKKVRFLRRQGITPAHLFGHGLQSLSLQCDTAKLQRVIAQAGTTRLVSLEVEGEKKPRSVFVREIQRHVTTGVLFHIDFYQVSMKEKIKADVPIILVGEAPALKERGRSLLHGVTSLSVECLPDKLPPQIEVDVSSLEEAEQAIYVSDLVLDPEITISTAADQMLVKVNEARVVEEVEEVVEEVVAGVEMEAEAPAPGEEVTGQETAD